MAVRQTEIIVTAPEYKPIASFGIASPYTQPSLDELIQLSMDFGLVNDVRHESNGRLSIKCKEETFRATLPEAQLLIRGLLIGFFAMHTRDDLSLANWEN